MYENEKLSLSDCSFAPPIRARRRFLFLERAVGWSASTPHLCCLEQSFVNSTVVPPKRAVQLEVAEIPGTSQST